MSLVPAVSSGLGKCVKMCEKKRAEGEGVIDRTKEAFIAAVHCLSTLLSPTFSWGSSWLKEIRQAYLFSNHVGQVTVWLHSRHTLCLRHTFFHSTI